MLSMSVVRENHNVEYQAVRSNAGKSRISDNQAVMSSIRESDTENSTENDNQSYCVNSTPT